MYIIIGPNETGDGMTHNRAAATDRECGFSLLEALVSMVIISIGLLGLAALQASGIRFNHDAYVRTQATNLAYDVIERMRIDSVNAIGSDAYKGTYSAASPTAECNYHSVAVSAAINCWQIEIRDNLPGGEMDIGGVGGTNSNEFTIAISWQDRWQQKGTSESDYTASIQNWTIAL